MLPPHGEDTDQEGEGRHDHLPGLACTELTMVSEYLPNSVSEHCGRRRRRGSTPWSTGQHLVLVNGW